MNHKQALEILIKDLSLIDEPRSDVKLICREPDIFRYDSLDRMKCCDLFVGFYDQRLLLVELKHSANKLDHAILQLTSSYHVARDLFDTDDIQGKVVYYMSGKFTYQTISLANT